MLFGNGQSAVRQYTVGCRSDSLASCWDNNASLSCIDAYWCRQTGCKSNTVSFMQSYNSKHCLYSRHRETSGCWLATSETVNNLLQGLQHDDNAIAGCQSVSQTATDRREW